MELTIDFTCPRCHQIAKLKLVDFTPGHSRLCRACHVPLDLTASNLQTLSRNLERYCQG